MDGIHHRTRVQAQLRTPRTEPLATPFLYPSNMHLTYGQHLLVTVGSAATAAVVSRPIYNVHQFSFLSLVPTFLNAAEKQLRLEHQLRTMKWFTYPTTLAEQFCAYSIPFAVDCFVYPKVQWLFGRDTTTERKGRYIERRYVEFDIVIPGIHSDSRMDWVADGFISGAAAGLAYTALTHPADVLRHAVTAPDAPRRFTGPLDVLMTSMRHKPQLLTELYKGFGVAAMANSARFATFFGLYHFWKWELGTFHWVWFTFAALVTNFFADIVHYPFHKVRAEIVKANARRRFSKLTARELINEFRRTVGITIVYDGFFSRRPLFIGAGYALMLTMYDYGLRFMHDRTKTASAAAAAPTTKRA